MWELHHKEGWALKNRCFQIVCWRRLLRALSTARRSNQSILKEVNPKYSLDGLMLKLKFQCFDHLMWRANSLKMTPVLGKIEGKSTRGQQRMRWLGGIIDTTAMSLNKLWEIVKDREAWCAAVREVSKSQIWFSDWTAAVNVSWMKCDSFICGWSWQLPFMVWPFISCRNMSSALDADEDKQEIQPG